MKFYIKRNINRIIDKEVLGIELDNKLLECSFDNKKISILAMYKENIFFLEYIDHHHVIFDNDFLNILNKFLKLKTKITINKCLSDTNYNFKSYIKNRKEFEKFIRDIKTNIKVMLNGI